MNITLKLNNEIIKYGICHIYSNSNLSTPVILSNGNGSGGNTITANVSGVVALTASNCPAYIYCRIESSPSANNSANFRLKTDAISGYSASAAAKTINMGFNSSNIFVATDAKCAIGYDLLTLGYRYSFGKITPANYTIPTGTSTDMVLYNKAFTYKAINSLDKTGYGSTTTQTTFGTYSSINATNMLNTTRGVNLTIPTLKLTSTNSLGALYKSWSSGFNQNYTTPYDNYDTAEGIIYAGKINKIGNNEVIVPSSTANGSYSIWDTDDETNPAAKFINNCTVTYSVLAGCNFLDTHWLPMCRFIVDSTSIFHEFGNISNGIKFNSPGTQLRFTYKSDIAHNASNVYFKVCLCKINESDLAADYYKPIYSYNYKSNTGYLLAGAENEIIFTFPTSISSSISFEQGATYIYFLRLIVQNPNDFSYMYFNFTNNGTYINHSLTTNVPEKVVTFKNVSKNPLVPVYLTLVSGVNNCKLSYLKISYSNYSYTTGNSSKTLDSGKATSALHWLNANPGGIGLSTVSYSNLYKNINISGGNNTTGERTKKTTTYIAKATPAVCYNGFTTTQWYTTQSSTKSYQTNAVFNISAITSTNIKYSINEVLSGKHKLTQIRVDIS